MDNFMDLSQPEYSYMIGFIQCDGHMRQLTRNRGGLSIELAYRDIELLRKFKELTPYNSNIRIRTRDTNFKTNYKSVIWSLHMSEAREQLIKAGMIYGKKSEIIMPPAVEYVEIDYIRGLIDADGSVGICGDGRPFISFTSKSKAFATIISNYMHKISGTRINPCLNKRDKIYTMMLVSEAAQQVIRSLYYKNCLCLKRKLQSSMTALKWKRPLGSKRRMPTNNLIL